MDVNHAKRMMDAFYEAKRIRDQMPPLPEGVNPSYINTLDAIRSLAQTGEPVRVSDVAAWRHLPRPGVTRTIKEMETIGLLIKEPDEQDHRVVRLRLTPRGEELYQTYVEDYFAHLTGRLADVSNAEIEAMEQTIRKVRTELKL